MANLLDKMLKARGIASRIIHMEGNQKIHTVVEFQNETSNWILVDPQENMIGNDYGNVSGADILVDRAETSTIPPVWQDYNTLYIYEYWNGYEPITAVNTKCYYGVTLPQSTD